MHQAPNQGPPDVKASIGWLLFFCRALAASVEVFLHRTGTFGERYLGPQVGIALLFLLFYPVFWQGHNIEPVMLFLGVFLGMCVVIRARTQRRRARGGPQPHTLYGGYPRLARIAGKIGEPTIKSKLEPLLVWLTGLLVSEINRPLGAYLMLAAFGLAISVHAVLSLERKRALDMHDALIDQRGVTERFRHTRGE